jgi:hypothetical protein
MIVAWSCHKRTSFVSCLRIYAEHSRKARALSIARKAEAAVQARRAQLITRHSRFRLRFDADPPDTPFRMP